MKKLDALKKSEARYGQLKDNEDLMYWAGGMSFSPNHTVLYTFNDGCVMYSIGENLAAAWDTSISGEDAWEDCDEEYLGYLYSLPVA